VVIPKRNEKDLEDLPQEIRDEMKFVLVDRVDEVLTTALRDGRANQSPEDDDECR
jgi:ATP-dependent Lon protease